MSKPIIPSLFHDSSSRYSSVPDGDANRSGELLGVAHGSSNLSFRVAFGEGLAAILLLFSSRESQFDLGPSALEVELQRDDGERLGLGLVVEVFYLVSVHEKFALAIRIVTAESHCEGPRGYVHLEEPEFTVVDSRVRVGDLGVALAQRFHLGASQHDAALECLENLVVEAGAAVRGDHSVTTGGFALGFGAPFLHLLGSCHGNRLVTKPGCSSGSRVNVCFPSSGICATP